MLEEEISREESSAEKKAGLDMVMHSTNPCSQRSVGSSSGGTSTRSSCPEPPLFAIDEFLQGIPQVVENCLGKDVTQQADKQGVYGSPESQSVAPPATFSNHGGGATPSVHSFKGEGSSPPGCPPSTRTGSPPASVVSGMTGGHTGGQSVNGIPGYSGAGFAAGLAGLSGDPKECSSGFSTVMGQFQNMQPGVRSLQSMMSQVLSGLVTAQEQRSRQDVEEMEEYIQYLQAQLEFLQEQQPVMQHNPEETPSDEEIEAFNKSSSELKKQLDECQRLNDELKAALEKEKKAKLCIEQEYGEIKQKIDSLDGIHNKYKAIQLENRKLYNMVQDLRGNIRVFCRVRPLGATGDGSTGCIETGNDGDVAVLGGSKDGKSKIFNFDKIFGMNSSQEEVYAETQPLIRSVLDGYNVCIFAYGQTGSGKTHTMSGSNVENYSGRGINYRALDDLFDIRRERSDEVDYDIKVTMLEIYNENLRDLLAEGGGANKLEIRSTEKSGQNVPDAVQRPVSCTEDVLEFMEIGTKNRAVGSTKMNSRSSRSHSVLTVMVTGTSHVTGMRTHGCLHLVDLAGSERVGRTEASGEQLEEAKHINKSLSALGDVMSALASKGTHVPFRNSKLTQLLQESLMGQAKAMMFMHIAPEDSSRSETLSTLMFGQRVSQITLGAAQKNTESTKIFEARDAIKTLREGEKSKEKKIQELENIIISERATARKAEKERERMEKELKALQEKLNLTRRAQTDAYVNPPHTTARTEPRKTGPPKTLSRKPTAHSRSHSMNTNPAMTPCEPPSTRSTVSRKSSATTTTAHRRSLSSREKPTTAPSKLSSASKTVLTKSATTKDRTSKVQTKATSALTRSLSSKPDPPGHRRMASTGPARATGWR